MSDAAKFYAFLSYSHRDKVWSDWLHRSLERYAVPRRLVGRPNPDGVVPRRLFPIFRDREELPTSNDLGGSIRGALAASKYLVVICSPASARSRWVNEEVAEWKRLGRGDRIICLIVGGEPNASDKTDGEAEECFCPALRFAGAEGEPGAVRVEPIASDVRATGDGKPAAFLKIVAGLLRVGYDELRQRDRAAKRKRWAIAASAAAVLLAGGGGTLLHFQAEAQRAGREKQRQAALATVERARLLHAEGKTDEGLQAIVGHRGADGLPEGSMLLRQMYEQSRLRDVLGRYDSVIVSSALGKNGALALGTNRGRADVWEMSSQRRIGAFDGVGDRVAIARRDADGALFLVAGGQSARLIDAETGALRASLDGHTDRITDAAFAPGENRAITVSSNGEIFVWDTATGRIAGRVEGNGWGVFAVSASNHGQFAVLAYDFGGRRAGEVAGYLPSEVRVYDLHSRAQLRAFRPTQSLGTTGRHFLRLAFAPNGQFIATATEADARNVIQIWSVASGEPAFKVYESPQPGRSNHLVYSPNGFSLAADVGREVHVWNTSNGRLRGQLRGHTEPISSVAFDRKSERVLTAAGDGTARIWQASGTVPAAIELRGHQARPLHAHWDEDGGRVFTASWDGTVRVWSVASRLRPRPESADASHSMAFLLRSIRSVALRNVDGRVSPRATIIEAKTMLDGSGRVRVVDLDSNRSLPDLVPPERSQNHNESFSADGDRLAVSYADNALRVWSVNDGALLATMKSDNGFDAIAFNPDGKSIAALVGSAGLKVWNANTGALLWSAVTPRPGSAEYDRTGRSLVVTYSARAVVYGAADGKQIAELAHEGQWVQYATFAPDGRVLTATDDGRLHLWDVPTGNRLASWRGHEQRIVKVIFSADGRHAASQNNRDSIVVWDVGFGMPLLRFPSQETLIAFQGDGTTMITHSGGLNLWNLEIVSPAAASAWARRIVERLGTKIAE